MQLARCKDKTLLDSNMKAAAAAAAAAGVARLLGSSDLVDRSRDPSQLARWNDEMLIAGLLKTSALTTKA